MSTKTNSVALRGSTRRTRKPKEQKADDWETLHYPDNVRRRSGMYIGENDAHGLFQILKEPIDNSSDEFLAGRNKFIHVHIEGVTYFVQDGGGGIPVEKSAKLDGKSPLEAAFNELHSGGKFSGKAYAEGSAGCNGVGAAVTSAMCDRLVAYTFRKGAWYSYSSKKGIGSGVRKCAAPKLPKQMKSRRGTVVKFVRDASLFQKGSKLNISHLMTYLDTLAYLHGGMEIKLTTNTGISETMLHKNGTVDYVKHIIEEEELTMDGSVFHINTGRTDVSFAVTNGASVLLDTYVCASVTLEGGTHLTAFKKALTTALAPFKLKKHAYTADDLLFGLVGIVNFNMVQPQFSSQTKERLTSTEGKLVCDDIQAALIAHFKKNKALAKRMLDKASALKKNRDSFNANRKALAGLTNNRKGKLPAKLNQSNPKTPANEVELILVEGDSAGGTAKNAVDKRYQEVLPLKGKIVAAYKNTMAKLMESEEVKNIFQSIGFDGKAEHPLEKMRIGKLGLLMDADVDGCHIELLVLSAIWRLCPDLIRNGHVYLIKGPLFCTTSKPLVWGDTIEEVQRKCKSRSNVAITRIKGWGEVNPSALNAFAFDEDTRHWIKVLPPKTKKDETYFLDLVGKDAAVRRRLLNL